MKNVRRNSVARAGGDESLEAEEGHAETRSMVQQLAKDICNIVFMDVTIPGLTALEAASVLKVAYPEINVLLLTLDNNKKTIENVSVPLSPVTPAVSLTEFISHIYEASMQTSITAVEKVLAFYNRKTNGQMDTYGLSPREVEVLDCLVNGHTYKKIAEHCHISVGTVRSHIMNIYRKLEVNSRSGAIVKAMQERLTGN